MDKKTNLINTLVFSRNPDDRQTDIGSARGEDGLIPILHLKNDARVIVTREQGHSAEENGRGSVWESRAISLRQLCSTFPEICRTASRNSHPMTSPPVGTTRARVPDHSDLDRDSLVQGLDHIDVESKSLPAIFGALTDPRPRAITLFVLL
jgi:hypothetical protein